MARENEAHVSLPGYWRAPWCDEPALFTDTPAPVARPSSVPAFLMDDVMAQESGGGQTAAPWSADDEDPIVCDIDDKDFLDPEAEPTLPRRPSLVATEERPRCDVLGPVLAARIPDDPTGVEVEAPLTVRGSAIVLESSTPSPWALGSSSADDRGEADDGEAAPEKLGRGWWLVLGAIVGVAAGIAMTIHRWGDPVDSTVGQPAIAASLAPSERSSALPAQAPSTAAVVQPAEPLAPTSISLGAARSDLATPTLRDALVPKTAAGETRAGAGAKTAPSDSNDEPAPASTTPASILDKDL